MKSSYSWMSFSTIMLTIIIAFPVSASSKDTPETNSSVTFVYYTDLEEASHFYEEILGLEKSFDGEWVKIYRMSDTGFVGLVDNQKGSLKNDGQQTAPVMISFVTSVVQQWYDLVKEKAPDSIKRHLIFGREGGSGFVDGFSLTDPGGYEVEFFQWREGFGLEE